MKKHLLIFSFIASLLTAQAQPYGNEWINPSFTHYKIKITQDGIHRIPVSALTNYIQGASLVKAKAFAMFHNGQPVPLYVSVHPDTAIGINGYIEFYGEKNKGHIDSLLYDSASYQINPEYSLFTDTSVYFLTTNNQPDNPRLVFEQYNTNLPYLRADYFLHKSQVSFSGQYFEGEYYAYGSTELYKPTYDKGEGYTNSSFFGSSPQSFSIQTPFLYSSSVNAVVKTYFANNSQEHHKVYVNLNGNQIYQQTPDTIFGFRLHRPSVNISNTQLVSGNNTISFQDMINGPSQRRNIVGYIEIEYPRQFNFGGSPTFNFRIAADAQNSKYFEINNFNSHGTRPLLYDLTNKKIYRDTGSTAPFQFKIPPSSTEREMYLRADDTYNVVSSSQISTVDFVDYPQGEYYIITNSKLLDNGSGVSPVEDYKAYRDIKYDFPQIADIEQLYDQFGYGIRQSPLAIRNFISYAKDTLGLNYVFIIGKGRENFKMRDDLTARNQCLVPTFGFPGSDNLLAASRGSDTAHVAIGRLAAENKTQISDYLDKVEKYEHEQDLNFYTNDQAIPPKDWQKKILHFSGGTTSGEQQGFKNAVYGYAQIATDTSWGADTSSYSKTTAAPIQQSLSDVIKTRINQGVSWITFFGHSATGAFDFSIDEPENYTNSPKFPIILSNGCFSGFIHDVGVGFSERFVFAPDKAAIAFMATSNLSLPGGLNIFSDKMYRNVCQTNYLQTLGKSFQRTYNSIVCCDAEPANLGVAYEMTLHGDPGLLVNQYPKPDYAIDSTSVYFTPSTITPSVDSFDVNVIVVNLGKAIQDSIAVTLNRSVPDPANPAVPAQFYYRKKVPVPYYKDTIIFTIPVNVSNLGYGQNTFDALVDADHHIDEMAECNNGIEAGCTGGNVHSATIYIQNDDIIPIYPYEFAIVPDSVVTLKASTVNPFAPLRSYRFEIDTSELFANPIATGIVTQIGGVVRWPVPMNFDAPFNFDSTVFYWRVAKDTTTNEINWHYSSFIYLKGEYREGWNQSHYFQWQKDNYLNMFLADTDRIFKFPPTTNGIHVYTGWADAVGGNISASVLGWDLNNVTMHRYRMGGCGFLNGITIAVIDPAAGGNGVWQSKNEVPNDYGEPYANRHCFTHAGPQYGFDFLTDLSDGGANELYINYIATDIPAGAYVLIYSNNIVNYSLWTTTMVTALQSLGFTEAQDFKNGTKTGPFIHFSQKDNPGYPRTIVTSPSGSFSTPITADINFNANWYQGQFTSPKIGPAVEWKSVHWTHDPLEQITYDRDTMDVIGVRQNGTETLLLSTVDENNLFIGGNSIDDSIYPYLKLRLRTRDDSLRTPTQMKYWRVLYKKPPEAAINPAAHFNISSTNVNIGQGLHLEIGLENVTDIDMDSMLTKYVVRDAAFSNQSSYIRYGPLGGLDTMHLIFDLPVNGSNYAGLNKIIIEANPDNDQIEQYHFNNIAEINFTGTGDNINPLLDVTFDNQHIMNGDIVSAKPNILITLKDENKFLALDDQSLIDVYLKYPGETTPRKIVYDNSVLTFYPADAANLSRSNKAQVEFKPVLPLDGKYDLIIKDRDRSGNNSSTDDSKYIGNILLDYQISFEVINKPMITNVLNYPNPFTTSTKFIFTITGSEIPDFLKIQIMTIKGTVVKEIMKEDLGDLHIGRNITQYTWDGRDQYGDLLANGVYFYHVSVRLDDKRMDHMGQSYDKYFKKGFGKLVIVR